MDFLEAIAMKLVKNNFCRREALEMKEIWMSEGNSKARVQKRVK